MFRVDEVSRQQHPVEVDALVERVLAFGVVAGPHLALQLTADREHGARRRHRLGRAPDAKEDVDVAVELGRGDRSRDVAVTDQLDPGAGLTDCGDVGLVAGAVEDDRSDVADSLVQGLRHLEQVVLDGCLDVDRTGGGFADGDLVHVDQAARGEHRAPLRHGDHGQRAAQAQRR